MTTTRTLTQAELVAEAKAAFGEDSLTWAFSCPNCGDIATAGDFKSANADPPPRRPGVHRPWPAMPAAEEATRDA